MSAIETGLFLVNYQVGTGAPGAPTLNLRSEEHTSELQSHVNLVCRLLLEKKKQHTTNVIADLGSTDGTPPSARMRVDPVRPARQRASHWSRRVGRRLPSGLRRVPPASAALCFCFF